MTYETNSGTDNGTEPLAAEAPAETVAAEPAPAPSANELASLEKVRHYMAWSAAGGLVPIPGLDLAAVLAAQLKLLSELSAIYGVPFKQDLAKPVIGSLIGGVGSLAAAQATSWAIRSIPVVGTLASALWQPAIASAATWALGKVFIQHFESGGTFLDFNPEKVRAYFREQYEAARAGKADSSETAQAA